MTGYSMGGASIAMTLHSVRSHIVEGGLIKIAAGFNRKYDIAVVPDPEINETKGS